MCMSARVYICVYVCEHVTMCVCVCVCVCTLLANESHYPSCFRGDTGVGGKLPGTSES